MSACFVHSYRFSVQFYHIHYFNSIVRVFLSHEFDESVALMHLSHPVFGHMDVDHWSGLYKQFPHKGFCNFVVQTADVYRSILITFCNGTGRHNYHLIYQLLTYTFVHCVPNMCPILVV